MNKSKINAKSESDLKASSNAGSSNSAQPSGISDATSGIADLRNRLTEIQKRRGPKAEQPAALQFARSLDAQRAVLLLLKHLFPDGEFRFSDMGRYAVIQQRLVKQETLLNRLLINRPALQPLL